MANWYLRKSDGTEYGPSSMDALRQWAEDGRIAPEDQLSQDRATWVPAPSVEALEMHYEIVLESGDRYGPLHLLALKELVEDGSIDTTSPIRHTSTDKTKCAGDHLLDMLTGQNTRLQTRVGEQATQNANLFTKAEELTEQNRELTARTEQLTEQLAKLEERLAQQPVEPPPKVKEKPGTATYLQSDSALKDAQKFQALYESERAQRLEADEKLAAENRNLRQELHEAQTARDRITYKASQLEKHVQEMQSTLEGKGVFNTGPSTTDMESYQHFSKNYASLMQQLREKTEELNRLRASRGNSEEESSTRLRQMEERMQQEREEADKARQRLAELESTHMEVVRSYRDLNDRYIRLRQQVPNPLAPQPTPRTAPEKETVHETLQVDGPAPPAAAADNSETKPAWKPKVRLT